MQSQDSIKLSGQGIAIQNDKSALWKLMTKYENHSKMIHKFVTMEQVYCKQNVEGNSFLFPQSLCLRFILIPLQNLIQEEIKLQQNFRLW